MTRCQRLGVGVVVIERIADDAGRKRQRGAAVSTQLAVSHPDIPGGPAVGNHPSRVEAGCAVHIACGQCDRRSRRAHRAIGHTAGFDQGGTLRASDKRWSVISAGEANAQRGGIRDQVAQVFHRVGKDIDGVCARCQRFGRVGNVAVATVCRQCQVTVAACQHGVYACALRDGTDASDGATDQQRSSAVVNVGIGARHFLDHTVGGTGSQRGVFIDRTQIRHCDRRIVHRCDVKGDGIG